MVVYGNASLLLSVIRAQEGKFDIPTLEGKMEFQHACGTFHKGESKEAKR